MLTKPVSRCAVACNRQHRPPGISVEITEYTPNAARHNDELHAAAFRANAEELGRRRENDPRIQAELKYLRAEFLRRMRSDHPRQLVSLLRMARDPAVGLFLDERPVKVLYRTDLARCHRRCRLFTPTSLSAALAQQHRRVHTIGRYR